MIERALAIQSETGEPRNLARLRQTHANMVLRLHPEESEKARDLLLRAQRDMEGAATSAFDRAQGALDLAWAEIALHHPQRAVEYAQAAVDLVRGTSGWLETRAALILSQARFMLHQDEEAAAELDTVSQWLENALATRKAAEDWMTIAEMRRRIGEDEQSVAAYQRALACVEL